MKTSNVAQFLALVASSYAQSETVIGSLYLTSPGDFECSGLTETDNAIGFNIYQNFTEGCINLATIFEPSLINADGTTSCPEGSEGCESSYQTLMARNYNSDSPANYSYAGFRVSTGQLEQEFGFEATNLTIQLFGTEGCTDWSEQRLFQAGGCDDADFSCKELPWSVMSFQIMPTPEHNPSTCEFDQLESAGVRGPSMSFAAALIAVIASGMSLLL